MGPVNATIHNTQHVIESTRRFFSPKTIVIAALAIGVIIAWGIILYRHYQSRTTSQNSGLRPPNPLLPSLPSTNTLQTAIEEVQPLSEFPLTLPQVHLDSLPNEVLEFARSLGKTGVACKEVENGEWEVATNTTIYRIKPTFQILEDISTSASSSLHFETEVEYHLIPEELKDRALPESAIPSQISSNFGKFYPFGYHIREQDEVNRTIAYSLYINGDRQEEYCEIRLSESPTSTSCSSSNLTLQDFPPQFRATPIPEAVETLGRLFRAKKIEKRSLESEENIEDITWRVTYNNDRIALIGRNVAIISQKPRQKSDDVEGYVSPAQPESMAFSEETQQSTQVPVPTWVHEQTAQMPEFEVFGYQYMNAQTAGTRFSQLPYEWWRAYGLLNGQLTTRDFNNQTITLTPPTPQTGWSSLPVRQRSAIPNEVAEFGLSLGEEAAYKPITGGVWEVITQNTEYYVMPAVEILTQLRSVHIRNSEHIQYRLVPNRLRNKMLPDSFQTIPEPVVEFFRGIAPFGFAKVESQNESEGECWEVYTADRTKIDRKSSLKIQKYPCDSLGNPYYGEDDQIDVTEVKPFIAAESIIPPSIREFGKTQRQTKFEHEVTSRSYDKNAWLVTFEHDQYFIVKPSVRILSQRERSFEDLSSSDYFKVQPSGHEEEQHTSPPPSTRELKAIPIRTSLDPVIGRALAFEKDRETGNWFAYYGSGNKETIFYRQPW